MSGKASRTKGGEGEREVVALLKDYGWPRAERSSNGRTQTLRGDIANGPHGVSIEVKRCEVAKPWAWWEQATRDAGDLTPVVFFRRSRSPWLSIVEAPELLSLLAMREQCGCVLE